MSAKEVAGFTKHCPVRGHGEYVDTGLGCQNCAGVQKRSRSYPRHDEREVERALKQRPKSGPVEL